MNKMLGYSDYKPWLIYCCANQKCIASYRFRNEAEAHNRLINGKLKIPMFVICFEPEKAMAR